MRNIDKKSLEVLNREVGQYRQALRYFAGTCDWESFRSKAAQLFEYLESATAKLLEKRYQLTVAFALILLGAGILLFVALGRTNVLFFARHREAIALVMLAIFACELLLLLEFRLYLSIWASQQKKREDRFIKKIEGNARAHLGADACPGSA